MLRKLIILYYLLKYTKECSSYVKNANEWLQSKCLVSFLVQHTCPMNTKCQTSINSTLFEQQRNSSGLIVLSYGHNGFGNQLWEHTFAALVAHALGATFYIDTINFDVNFGERASPNTGSGAELMDRIMPDQFKYYLLGENASDKLLCDGEPFYVSDRPRNLMLAKSNYSLDALDKWRELFLSPYRRCLKMVGYYQEFPFCRQQVREQWYGLLSSVANSSLRDVFHKDDMSVYLRCQPTHYFVNDVDYYRAIINQTRPHHLWLFLDPRCWRYSGKPHVIGKVMRYLRFEVNATIWRSEGTNSLLSDFSGLVFSPRLILPGGSTWAWWAGFLSSAAEVHVDVEHHKEMGPDLLKYVYHRERSRQHFGRYVMVNGSAVIQFDSDRPQMKQHQQHQQYHLSNNRNNTRVPRPFGNSTGHTKKSGHNTGASHNKNSSVELK